MIAMKEILETMHSGAAFSLKCVTYDRNRKDRSGRILFIECGKLVWGTEKKANKLPISRPLTPLERELIGGKDGLKKNPNHSANATRNVRQYVGDLPTADIRKIHIRLIVEFNGQPTTP